MRNALCSAGLMLILSLSLSGQTLGTISGEVRDISGGVVPNAKAIVTNTATNTSRNTVTNNEGIYAFPSLVPGFYEVRIEHSGFSTATSTLELQVQQTARVDFALPVGPASETIEVSAAAALLATDNATVGTVIEGRRIVGLPLNGRNFLQLVSLSPNVTYGFQTPGQAILRQGGTRVLENISISGMRGTWNHYTLDGIENTDVNFNLYILLPSVDALQEFKVQSGIYSAEFGRSAGQVNVSTKPGTNQFHGVLYEFLRNSELDAKPMDFLGTTPAKTPFRWNQYGVTLGGPVWVPKVYSGRNRLFFMSNFEGYRDRKTTYRRGTFPTVAMRGGDFSSHVDSKGAPLPIYDPLTTCSRLSNPACPVDSKGTKLIVRQQFPGNKIPPSRFDPVSLKLLEFWAIPNIATPVLNNNYEAPRSDTIDKDQFTLRMDFSESSSSQWFGRYSWTDESAVNPGIRLNGSTLYTRGRQYMVSNTRVLSPAKVNEFRVGISTLLNTMGQELGGVRNVVEEVGLPFKYPDPDTWGIPTITGMTGGLSGFGDGNTPFRIEDSIYQVLDNFSLVRGKHSVRFGGEYRYDKYPQIGNEAIRPIFWFNSQYTRSQILSSTGAITNMGGSSAADYLLGTPSSGDIAIALAEADFRANNLASYIDDTWRLSPKVTIHLGLRWEQFQPYRDALQNQVNLECKTSPFYMANVPDASLHPVLVRTGSGDFYEGKQFRYVKVPVARDGRLGRRLMQSDWNNLAPRFGLAYSPSDKLSVRTGFGVFYSAESGNSRFDMNRGLAGRAGQSPSPDFPTLTYQNILTGVTLPVQLPASILWGVKPNVRTSYSMMYLLNIQRQLSQNLALELGYNGALHRKLQGLQNMNPAVPGTTTSLASRRMFPEYGTLQVVQGEGTGNYNGLGVKLTRRYSHGMTGTVSYTWSKALDLTSAIRGNYADIFPQDSTCLRCDYGPSVYNTPHRLVASFLYELPFGAGEPLGNYGGLANYIIGGWELSSIVTVQSGRPQNTRSWDSAGQGLYGETRLNATGLSPYLPSGQRNANGWLNPAAFTNTVSGQFGNVGRNALIGPTTWAWDSSAMKNFRILEGHQLQFRFEAFNVANHPALAGPSPAWGSQNPTPATAFGQIRQTAVTMRELQFALRYSF